MLLTLLIPSFIFKADQVLRRHIFLGTRFINLLELKIATFPSRRTTCSKGATHLHSCFICTMCHSRWTTFSKGATHLLTDFGRRQTPGVNTPSGELVGDKGPLRNKVPALLHTP
jgi:hypothetical protein